MAKTTHQRRFKRSKNTRTGPLKKVLKALLPLPPPLPPPSFFSSLADNFSLAPTIWEAWNRLVEFMNHKRYKTIEFWEQGKYVLLAFHILVFKILRDLKKDGFLENSVVIMSKGG